jgi:toxin ParE1/3/4
VKRYSFHDDAAEELQAGATYYESRVRGLGRDFLIEVEKAIRLIRQHPEIGAPHKETGFRGYVLPRFPYVLFFADLDEAICILAVAHASRRPGYWKDRKPD